MRPRDLERERAITRHAAFGVADPEPLIRFAEERAAGLSGEYVPDAMQVRTDRHRPTDVREELADGRNHLTWDIEDNPDDPEIPLTRKYEAMALICRAYHLLTPTGRLTDG